MSLPNIPAQLANDASLGMAIYTQWRINMINANVAGARDWPLWMNMDPDTRTAFVKSIQSEVIDLVKMFHAEMELDHAFTPNVRPSDPDPTPPAFPSRPNKPSPCYTCGSFQVAFPGGTCDNCSHLLQSLVP